MVYKWVQDLQVDLFCSSLVHLYSFLCWLLPAAGCWDMRYSWRQESVFGREKEQNEKSEQHQEEHFFCFDVHTAVSNYSTRLVQNEPITHLFKVIATS